MNGKVILTLLPLAYSWVILRAATADLTHEKRVRLRMCPQRIKQGNFKSRWTSREALINLCLRLDYPRTAQLQGVINSLPVWAHLG